MKKCAIIGAGDIKSYNGIKESIITCDFIISADGGYDHLLKMGISPNLAIGDFDSIKSKPKANEIITLPKEKDETDTFSAINIALEKGFDELYLFGMLGGRLDHTIANLQALLYLSQMNKKAYIIDSDIKIIAITNGFAIIPKLDNAYFSVFSFGEIAKGVTIENAKYTLSNAEIKNNFPIGVSNEFLDNDARVAVEDGSLLIIVCKDRTE